MTQQLIQVKNIKKTFSTADNIMWKKKMFRAVNDVSFDISVGEIVALVGGSGSGKTTLGKILVNLEQPTSGTITFYDKGHATDITQYKGKRLRTLRRQIQMIFQNPFDSLNPRQTIFDTIVEPLHAHAIGSRAERKECVKEMLEAISLAPADFMNRYPYQLSGGQLQRVAIARALVINPRLIVADEPTSMLDVHTRKNIINILLDLGKKTEVSYLYITHDLAVARHISDRILVMNHGKIVERGNTKIILQRPQHPYTQTLINSIPIFHPKERQHINSH